MANVKPDLVAAFELVIADVHPKAIPALLGDLERLKTLLWIRLLTTPAVNSPPETALVEDHLLTIPEAADLLSVPAGYVYGLARRGDFPTIKIGKYVRIRLADLREWVLQHQEKGLDRSLYTMYSHVRDDRRGASAHSKAARADAGDPGGAARRHPNHSRPVGARRSADPGANGPVDPTVGKDKG